MRFHRIAAALAVAAIAVMPLSGHALGEEARNVPSSICTVGHETLAFDAIKGVWNISGELDCRNGEAAVEHSQLAFAVSLLHFQGVDISTSGATIKRIPVASSGTIGCFNCSAIQGQAKRATLTAGLYMVESQAWVTQEEGGVRYGTHQTCFLVTGNGTTAPTSVPGCSP